MKPLHEMLEYVHRWSPIEDLPEEWPLLENRALRALESVWRDQRDWLEAEDRLRDFNERLKREWAIETGVIEGLYTLDRGITLLLIERGIDASLIPSESTNRHPELVAAMIGDHQEAVEGLFAFVTRARPLSSSYVKQLHQVLTRHQQTCTAIDSLGHVVEVELVRGDYKRFPNNPRRTDGRVHEYCPPEQTASEMDRLVDMHLAHMAEGVPPEVEAAWLHHRFVQIHPFMDGNGRVARCLASLVFLRAGWFPLVITRDIRVDYIDALENADQGDLGPLVRLFAARAQSSFVGALTTARTVRRSARVGQIIEAAREDLVRQSELRAREWDRARETARHLFQRTCQRLQSVAGELTQSMTEVSPAAAFFADHHPDDASADRSHYFRYQVIQTARSQGYFANLGELHLWARLALQRNGRAEILVSFHGLGREFRGLIAVSACFYRKAEADRGESEIVDLGPLSSQPFHVSYIEPATEAEARFSEWLEEVLVTGLEQWRRGL